ncbi:MAG: hypothetical protein K0Q48_2727 [Bacillota bacterium]|jgi:hypothetical protein|nr:hypothetical protein [Bacillota bacterium]
MLIALRLYKDNKFISPIKKVEMTESKIPISTCRLKGGDNQGAFFIM